MLAHFPSHIFNTHHGTEIFECERLPAAVFARFHCWKGCCLSTSAHISTCPHAPTCHCLHTFMSPCACPLSTCSPHTSTLVPPVYFGTHASLPTHTLPCPTPHPYIYSPTQSCVRAPIHVFPRPTTHLCPYACFHVCKHKPATITFDTHFIVCSPLLHSHSSSKGYHAKCNIVLGSTMCATEQDVPDGFTPLAAPRYLSTSNLFLPSQLCPHPSGLASVVVSCCAANCLAPFFPFHACVFLVG